MNGNFEVDRSRYPFQAVMFGEDYKVLHIPTQEDVLGFRVPSWVGNDIALRINTKYHAAKEGGEAFSASRSEVRAIARDSIKAVVEGVRQDQLLGRLELSF